MAGCCALQETGTVEVDGPQEPAGKRSQNMEFSSFLSLLLRLNLFQLAGKKDLEELDVSMKQVEKGEKPEVRDQH